MSAFTGRYHDGERWVVALCRRGTKKLHVTYIDDLGLRHMAVPLAEERYVQPLPFRREPYPLERMVSKFRGVARRSGATEAAKEELKRASGEAV